MKKPLGFAFSASPEPKAKQQRLRYYRLAMPRGTSKRKRFLSKNPLLARSIARFKSNRPVRRSKAPGKMPSQSSGDHTEDDRIERERSSDEEEHKDIVQADFAFFDPKPGDFHGVKILLQTYLDSEEWDLSSFVDLILGQTTVGTVVKIEDEEDEGLFSVITALNLGRYKDNQCILELKKFLLKVCQEKDVIDDLKLFLGENASDVGLLVSQRVVNLPPQLLPPLYDALFDEISWATEDEPSQKLRDSFRFKFYLIITKVYENKHADKQKKASKSGNSEPVIYIKPEDEIFHKLSLWSFTFPLRTQHATIHELRSYKLIGLVMVLKEDNVMQFREELKSLIAY